MQQVTVTTVKTKRTLMEIRHKQSEKVPKGVKRSGRWPTAKKLHLKDNPACVVCGATTGKIEVHHIKPFHLFPADELDPDNLITLCENLKNGVSCHLLFGHCGSFLSYNPNVVKDAKAWKKKIANRPKGAE
jgi:5-methylcytosine-specific restriction protein A